VIQANDAGAAGPTATRIVKLTPRESAATQPAWSFHQFPLGLFRKRSAEPELPKKKSPQFRRDRSPEIWAVVLSPSHNPLQETDEDTVLKDTLQFLLPPGGFSPKWKARIMGVVALRSVRRPLSQVAFKL